MGNHGYGSLCKAILHPQACHHSKKTPTHTETKNIFFFFLKYMLKLQNAKIGITNLYVVKFVQRDDVFVLLQLCALFLQA